jgi:hypothetical protein
MLFFEVCINLKTLRMPLFGTEGELPNPLRGFLTSLDGCSFLPLLIALFQAAMAKHKSDRAQLKDIEEERKDVEKVRRLQKSDTNPTARLRLLCPRPELQPID